MANPVGRPRNYNEEYSIATTYEIMDTFIKKNKFKTERAMGDFIENHIIEFANTINPKGVLKSYKREHSLGQSFYNDSTIRIDLRMVFDNGVYIIELKNPTVVYTELRAGIAQCMDYKSLFPEAHVILVSSMYSDIVNRLISNYKLDIGVVLINKTDIAIMHNQREVIDE